MALDLQIVRSSAEANNNLKQQVERALKSVEGIEADYVGVDVPDRYVFGYGMDYREQGRNLPAIYALKD